MQQLDPSLLSLVYQQSTVKTVDDVSNLLGWHATTMVVLCSTFFHAYQQLPVNGSDAASMHEYPRCVVYGAHVQVCG